MADPADEPLKRAEEKSSRPVDGRWTAGSIIKRLLFFLVLTLVMWQIWRLGKQIDWNRTHLHFGWLLAAMASYLAGWIPCVWYWRKIIAMQGFTLSWPLAIRSHFTGQLGKYVPGKAAALLIRGEMVRSQGVPLIVGVLTAGFESLATMAAGGCVAVALAPFLFTGKPWNESGLSWVSQPAVKWISVVAVIGITLMCVPVLTWLLNLVLGKIVGKVVKGETTLRAVNPPRWAFPVLMATWWLHGLSLGCTIQGVQVDGADLLPWTWGDWPLWTAAVSLGTVAGFVVLFAPGGAGVREGVLLTVLQGTLGPPAALVVVLLRFVWLMSELLAAALLMLLIRGPEKKV